MKLYKSRNYVINGQESVVEKEEENIVKIKPKSKVKSEKVNFTKSMF